MNKFYCSSNGRGDVFSVRPSVNAKGVALARIYSTLWGV